jgi:hypothetical protein
MNISIHPPEATAFACCVESVCRVVPNSPFPKKVILGLGIDIGMAQFGFQLLGGASRYAKLFFRVAMAAVGRPQAPGSTPNSTARK